MRAFGSVAEAAAASDAVSIVTPTTTHFELAKTLLQQGRHVLVEKPMTDNAAQAAELVQLAQQKNCVLQVGHVERFNPVFKYLESVATDPRFIETHRLSPYPARSTDIGVVLDLMIHDLDVVLAFVKSPVTSVDAVGIPVLSKSEDIANARLRFANGCVANLTASRVSPERMRKIRVFSGGAMTSYISLDYRAQEGFIYRIARDDEEESSLLKKLLRAKDSTIVSEFGGKRIVREPVPIAKEEPLKLELQHFVQCVRAHRTPDGQRRIGEAGAGPGVRNHPRRSGLSETQELHADRGRGQRGHAGGGTRPRLAPGVCRGRGDSDGGLPAAAHQPGAALLRRGRAAHGRRREWTWPST